MSPIFNKRIREISKGKLTHSSHLVLKTVKQEILRQAWISVRDTRSSSWDERVERKGE
jgi:hypothetical protein